MIPYKKNFIPDPDKAFESLRTELEWERRSDAPRCEYYCNDVDVPYTYGRGRGTRVYLAKPYTQAILNIRMLVEYCTTTEYPMCFLNRYLDQSDHLGWHADDANSVVTVSLGAEREIWFCPKDNPKDITKLKLEHGSMCIMPPGFQETHLHRIPKASFQCGERISLTFRENHR